MDKKIFIVLPGLFAIQSLFVSAVFAQKTFTSESALPTNKELLKDLLLQNQATLDRLTGEVQTLYEFQTHNATSVIPPKKTENTVSLMDSAAMKSSIFLPGGAPVPEGYGNNRQYQQLQQNVQTKSDKSEDDVAKDKRQNTTSKSNPPSSNSNNYSNYSGRPYYPKTSTKFQASFAAVDSNGYSYGIAKGGNTFINPFENASSSNEISLKITGNSTGSGSTYTSIKFCDPTYTTCNSALNMSSNTTNLSSDQLVGGSTSFALTSLSINGTTASYQVARLYAQITTNSNTTTNISFSFPVLISNCSVANNGDLVCRLSTSGTKVAVASN